MTQYSNSAGRRTGRLALAVLAFSLGLTSIRPAQAAPAPKPATKPTPTAKPTPGSVPPAAASTAPLPSLSPASPSLAPAAEEPKIHVVDIQVRGNKTVSDETILLSLPIHAGEDVARSQVMEAMQRIYGLGYFLDVKAATEPVYGGERLIFNVVENPVLKDVVLTGDSVFPEAELKKPFEAMKGRIINLKDVQAAIKDLEKKYAEKGYVLARVVDLKVEPTGTLDIRIAEGVIHAIKIRGNDETQDYVIRREITLKPGMIYNFQRMQDDLRRVYNLNYFDDIGIKYEPAANDPSQVDVIVSVKEKQTGTFQLSAGWSNQDGPLGILSLKKDNLFGRSQSISSDITISRNWAAEVNYFNPWIDEQHTSFGSSVFARQYFNYYAQFLEQHQGLSLSFGRPLFGQDPVTAQWRGAARIQSERVDLLGGPNYDTPADIVTGLTAGGSPAPNNSDFATSLGFTATFDSRDYVLNPNTGWFNTYSIDQFVPGLGDVKATRLQLSLNRYIPLWFGHTLAFDYQLGTMATPFGGQIPAYDRFYSTGPYLIRGWTENPSPQDLATAARTGQAFSGDSFTLGSIEYRFPIVNILSGVVFGDTGIFWDQAQGNFGWSRDRSGYGVGIRVNTPLGPLRLDYGLQAWGQPGQIHFSIGQKF